MPEPKRQLSWPNPLLAVASALLLVVGIAVCILALAYYRHFETVKVLAGALTSLVATMVGACLALWFGLLLNQQAAAQRHTDEQLAGCRQVAFDMHREFSSDDMLRARTEASRLLATQPDKTFDQLYQELPEAQTRCLFRVSEFYQRLALVVLNDRVDLALVPALFGPYFVWWWQDALKPKLVDPDPLWPDSVLIERLHTWMQAHAEPNDYALWVARSSLGEPLAAVGSA